MNGIPNAHSKNKVCSLLFGGSGGWGVGVRLRLAEDVLDDRRGSGERGGGLVVGGRETCYCC